MSANRTDWNDYDWQLIHEGPQPPALHMALDAAITDEVGAGLRPPTLRIWEWAEPAVVIGRFQSLKNEVDPDGAQRHGITVVRRVSGGGAMFMEPGNSITYSLSVPQALVQGMSFQESYAFLDAWVLEALKSLGIKAWYQPLNDIASDLGKIGGAAQARRSGAVLHHVTMAYDIDADKMVEVLRIGREKLSDKGTTSAKKRVDPLRTQTGLARADVIQRMVDTFAGLHRLSPGQIGEATLARAQAQADEKFSTAEWTAVVPLSAVALVLPRFTWRFLSCVARSRTEARLASCPGRRAGAGGLRQFAARQHHAGRARRRLQPRRKWATWPPSASSGRPTSPTARATARASRSTAWPSPAYPS